MKNTLIGVPFQLSPFWRVISDRYLLDEIRHVSEVGCNYGPLPCGESKWLFLRRVIIYHLPEV